MEMNHRLQDVSKVSVEEGVLGVCEEEQPG